jgi:hypothetical protein
MGLLLLLLSLSTEPKAWSTLLHPWSSNSSSSSSSSSSSHPTPLSIPYILPIITAGGILAFAMVASEFLVIQFSSVLTLSVAGIAKEILTLLLSAVLYGDAELSSPRKVAGLCVSLLGIAGYHYVRAGVGHRERDGENDSDNYNKSDRGSRMSGDGNVSIRMGVLRKAKDSNLNVLSSGRDADRFDYERIGGGVDIIEEDD